MNIFEKNKNLKNKKKYALVKGTRITEENGRNAVLLFEMLKSVDTSGEK